jgi:hypothetical protein
MRSSDPSATDLHLLDLDRDLPTTADDVRVLRALARQVSTWFHLTPQEIEALIPAGVLERRPPIPDGRPPFSLAERPDEPPASDS